MNLHGYQHYIECSVVGTPVPLSGAREIYFSSGPLGGCQTHQSITLMFSLPAFGPAIAKTVLNMCRERKNFLRAAGVDLSQPHKLCIERGATPRLRIQLSEQPTAMDRGGSPTPHLREVGCSEFTLASGKRMGMDAAAGGFLHL